MGVFLAGWVAAKGGQRIQGIGPDLSPFMTETIAFLGIVGIFYAMRYVINKKPS
jgi:hypothetical protein